MQAELKDISAGRQIPGKYALGKGESPTGQKEEEMLFFRYPSGKVAAVDADGDGYSVPKIGPLPPGCRLTGFCGGLKNE